jgi:hypothetical protein
MEEASSVKGAASEGLGNREQEERYRDEWRGNQESARGSWIRFEL